MIERTVTGEPAIIHGENFNYIEGWLDDISLKWVILAALENAKMEFVDLPIGVRLREKNKKRFWFNYSSRVQKKLGTDLKPVVSLLKVLRFNKNN